MSYDYDQVSILNSTSFAATGQVKYLSMFCSDDNYNVGPGPGTKWTGPARGPCLITQITALVNNVWATPYGSPGTSFGQFAIIQTGSNSFQVIRITLGAEDVRPADYVEPTAKQK